jgi:allophanate hydrolase
VIEGACGYSAADAFAGVYRLAELRRRTEGLWRDIDAMLVPTFPRPRTLADLEADPLGPNAELGTYTNFVNLLNLCAIAVPCRPRTDGLPAGVTLIAPAGHDALIASLGADLHAHFGGSLGATETPHPGAITRAAAVLPGEFEVAVVGAHLSGMPLNSELTSRGGRFLRAVATTPDYRLYALAGGSPPRPGLLRGADREGFAIQTEVWALPAEAFGSFVAGIPSPLGIGTVRLVDGTRPLGFIVEAEGIRGAVDVSAFGGWRAYTASLAA